MKRSKITIVLLISLLCFGCQQDFLDIKRDKKQVIPSTLEDFEAVLDNFKMNSNALFAVGTLGADDYYIIDEHWKISSWIWEKNAYVWNKDIFEGGRGAIWESSYEKILYSNLVLDGLNKVEKAKFEKQWNEIKGRALFFRAYTYYQLTQLFCENYEKTTSNSNLGLPLKITSDLNEKVVRSSVEQTYQFIIDDLKEVVTLLEPLDKSKHKNRPSLDSTLGLLARIYLQMNLFEEALFYAEQFLKIDDRLLNYNDVSSKDYYSFSPFGLNNPEYLLIDEAVNCSFLSNSRLRVNDDLLNLYEEYDLRKGLYYISNNDWVSYRGCYSGYDTFLGSPTTSEIYLILAESRLRLGKITEAVSILNKLLINRYETGKFQEIDESDPERLLSLVLLERRKELAFRGTRWSDLRRLNTDNRFAKTITRVIEGVEYNLLPGDKRYVWPFPDNEIKLSGIEQNQR